MSKPLMVGFGSSLVYCWRCKRLTRLKELGCDGLAPCSFCGAPMLAWYLSKIGLGRTQEAPQNAQNTQKPINSEQEGISKGNEGLGGNTP